MVRKKVGNKVQNRESVKIIDKNLKEKVLNQLQDKQFKWRTAQGISDKLNVKIVEVRSVLEGSDKVVKSRRMNRNGKFVYASRKRLDENTKISKRIINVLKNEVS